MDPLVDTKHNWLYVYAITAVNKNLKMKQNEVWAKVFCGANVIHRIK